jgi:pilus assembly protein Flp/PilA
MEKLMMGVKQFIADEEGVTMVEYGLIAALISIVVLIALTGVGVNVKAAFTRVCTALGTALGTGSTGCA